jgi:hypothetical protein
MRITIKETIDREAYLVWVRKLEDQLPLYVTCPECNGDGEGQCPHCGNMTDCDTCGGDGLVQPSVLLDEQFYLRVMAFEKARLEHWIQGEPLPVNNYHRNPLDLLETKPARLVSLSNAPKIILALPLTETSA